MIRKKLWAKLQLTGSLQSGTLPRLRLDAPLLVHYSLHSHNSRYDHGIRGVPQADRQSLAGKRMTFSQLRLQKGASPLRCGGSQFEYIRRQQDSLNRFTNTPGVTQESEAKIRKSASLRECKPVGLNHNRKAGLTTTSCYKCHSPVNDEPGVFSEFLSDRPILGHNLSPTGSKCDIKADRRGKTCPAASTR